MQRSSLRRNVYDPVFMRNVKKTFAKYKESMESNPRRAMSREAFVDVDDKGAAWYLGHMKSAATELAQKVKDADFVLEMRDARLPFSTENPNLRKLMRGKPHLIIFNKAELANEDCNRAIQKYYESIDTYALFTSARRTWRDTVEATQRFVTHVLPAKTFQTTAYCGLVVGMPNVGKSTLINSLRMAHEYQFHREDFHRSRTPETVSMTPGTTRGIKMIPICRDPNVVLYDSPGLTLPGCFSKEQGIKLAACGIIPTNNLTLSSGVVARYLYDVMQAAGAAEHLATCLHLPRSPISFDDCISLICERSGKSAQTELGSLEPAQAQTFLMHDFQLGKLGKLTLDRLPQKVKQQLQAETMAEYERLLGSDESSSSSTGQQQHHDEDSTSSRHVNDEGGFVYTHHVVSEDVVSSYPPHLHEVLSEVHEGRRDLPQEEPSHTRRQQSPKKGGPLGRGTPSNTTAAAAEDAFTISRRKGPISRASPLDETVRQHVRIRAGR